MKKLLVCMMLVSQIYSAQALDNKAVGGGISYSVPSAVAGFDQDIDNNSEISYNLGMIGFYRTPKGKKFRTGLMLVSKNAEIKSGTVKTDIKLLHLVMPLTIVRNLKKGMDIFYGLNPGVTVNDDCDKNNNAKCNGDARQLVHPLVIGARYSLDPKFNLEVSYEHALKEAYSGLKMNGLFINLFYNI